jgi:enamine deaminase RidA (YjgF/YER057c/UK114 family)
MIRSMELSAVDPSSLPAPVGGYVNGLEVRGAQRLLFISGQIPQDREGRVSDGIDEQCRLPDVWDPAWLIEIEAIAASA